MRYTSCAGMESELPLRSTIVCAAIAALGVSATPCSAQGLFGVLQQQNLQHQGPHDPHQGPQDHNVLAYAPSQGGAAASAPGPLNILPITPNAGAISRTSRRGRTPPPSPAALPPEEDEDAELLIDHETPKRVAVLLPPPRPGAVERTAAEVAPVGQARWASAGDQLPPGVSIPGLPSAGGRQSLPGAPRLAALPATQTTPRWTQTDEAPLRPPGLRESESPVANMPGVFAPPEARFDCLPLGLKQVLVDAAKRFGHVAILNAERGRGTGARQSYHYQCRAVDFRVRGVPVSTVYGFLREHPNVGGRKIYPMGFFHVDDGPVRSW
jgi:Bacterial protein of unknown function (DUF882)